MNKDVREYIIAGFIAPILATALLLSVLRLLFEPIIRAKDKSPHTILLFIPRAICNFITEIIETPKRFKKDVLYIIEQMRVKLDNLN